MITDIFSFGFVLLVVIPTVMVGLMMMLDKASKDKERNE